MYMLIYGYIIFLSINFCDGKNILNQKRKERSMEERNDRITKPLIDEKLPNIFISATFSMG
jgi:hypothetical protein